MDGWLKPVICIKSVLLHSDDNVHIIIQLYSYLTETVMTVTGLYTQNVLGKILLYIIKGKDGLLWHWREYSETNKVKACFHMSVITQRLSFFPLFPSSVVENNKRQSAVTPCITRKWKQALRVTRIIDIKSLVFKPHGLQSSLWIALTDAGLRGRSFILHHEVFYPSLKYLGWKASRLAMHLTRKICCLLHNLMG